ncbi:protein TIC 22, chloroplastic-like [Asparagus officinalis]|uniref:protein TIC 22, chloroplastic-like n=1 Tax=Asparagus officinalis TaxID=4686 RepID=UPI00098E7BAF|nr:protein TIC 22, chloroplastic-like [Asparagus officinalis]
MRSSSPPSSSSSTLPLSAAAPSMDPSNTQANPSPLFLLSFSRQPRRGTRDLSSTSRSRLSLPLPAPFASLLRARPQSGAALHLCPGGHDNVAPNGGDMVYNVRLRKPALGKGARVVPITLDQVYMLKVEGIAFRFLPDPIQIKNALQLKAADNSQGFDGVPVFQSDLLVIKKKNKRYCPIYFQKEDIERELSKVSRSSRAVGSSHIMVGSLEDVLKKMEMNKKNSGWEDLIFIPPGRSYTQHINEVAA